jgi:hypothetical protein
VGRRQSKAGEKESKITRSDILALRTSDTAADTNAYSNSSSGTQCGENAFSSIIKMPPKSSPARLLNSRATFDYLP